MSDDAKATCPICDGKGWIREEEMKDRKCICLQRRMALEHLGPMIAGAPHIRSPLFQPQPGKPAIDRTDENLFIKCKWLHFLPHLRWALGCKFNCNDAHTFSILTDERLLAVWLGSESYSQRSRASRDSRETFNNLQDLVGHHDLLIIRLGFLGYKNAAAPGVLQQALGIREVLLKPTWIVEEPSSIFGPGHFTYSEEVQSYIVEHFDVVDLRYNDETTPGPIRGVELPPELDGEEDVGMGLAGSSAASTVDRNSYMPKETIKAEPHEDLGLGMRKNAGKFKPGWKKFRPKANGSGGNGPMEV